MSRTYIGTIEHHLPKTLLVIDRFHVIKALNDSVDEVRKEVWRAASKAERKVMAELARTQRQVARACELKDEWPHF